ncbi:hypothetical protein ACT1UH_01915 [Mycoplasma sp. 332]|uniref:hypothetical protein n=1 Tax=Mycoplasma sp. 332 TaxID=3458236 RepID=UPI004036D9BC
MKNIDINKYNSIDELYKHNKKAILVKSMLFTAFLVVMFLSLMAIFIEYAVRKQVYLLNYKEAFSNANPSYEISTINASVEDLFIRKFAFSIVVALFSGAVLIWHIVSLTLSLKEKDFTKYSPWLLTLYSMTVMIIFINLFFSAGGIFRIKPWDINQILNLIVTIIFLIGYFTIYWPFSRIVKLFRIVRINNEQGRINEIFGQKFSQTNQQTYSTQPSIFDNNEQKNNDEIIDEKNNKSYSSQLETLSDEKLIIMAQKLNIFGASELKRKQLIEKISAIFENNNSNNEKANMSNNENNKENESDNAKEIKDIENNNDYD